MSNIQYYIINGHLVWKGRLNKINNQKVDNPPSFILRPLNYNDIDAMGKLSHQIYQHLQAGEECFIHKHDKQYYSKAINQKDLHYFGIFRGTQLVGMSYLRICRTPEEFAEEIPGCREQFFTSSKTTIAALGADSVLPEYRGNSLNKIMIAYRLELAKRLDCKMATSIVDRSNHWNMPPYFKNGFQMFGSAIDPADGGKIALMRHNLQSEKQDRSENILPKISIPFHRFDIIDKLFEKGFVGCAYNQETTSITFMPRTKSSYTHMLGYEQKIIASSFKRILEY